MHGQEHEQQTDNKMNASCCVSSLNLEIEEKYMHLTFIIIYAGGKDIL